MNKCREAAAAGSSPSVEAILYCKLDQAAVSDLDQARARLMTLTDFAYRQLCPCEENPFLPAILDAETTAACKAMVCEIKTDLGKRLREGHKPDSPEALKETADLLALL